MPTRFNFLILKMMINYFFYRYQLETVSWQFPFGVKAVVELWNAFLANVLSSCPGSSCLQNAKLKSALNFLSRLCFEDKMKAILDRLGRLLHNFTFAVFIGVVKNGILCTLISWVLFTAQIRYIRFTELALFDNVCHPLETF